MDDEKKIFDKIIQSSEIAHFSEDEPLILANSSKLAPFTLAYKTYGNLNDDKSNAVVVCHALTGDQFVASTHPVTGKAGWWELMVGKGRPIDTERFFVICVNVLGSCMGSTGPDTLKPNSNEIYALDFPVVTISDMVDAQMMLVDRLGIKKIFCVIGGSLGGMQVLQFAAKYKDRIECVIPIATAARHSSQNIAFHEVGRQAVMADPDWCNGQYKKANKNPSKGLAVARMAAHITYLSDEALHRKFGRNLQDRESLTFGFDADFQIESYLRYQGSTFVDRFDANSYLYLTRAMDYFDLALDYGGQLSGAFMGCKSRFCVVSFTSDWLFTTADSKAIVSALNAVAANVSFVEIKTDTGHDSFLLDVPEMFETLDGFIKSCAKNIGI